jgi:pimeloyl-ACP methyl ester carboxylesterase
MKWYSPPQRHLDTIVFVHGILGHYVRTWGRFPRLLSEDEELPEFDILLWGYRTGWFSRHYELRTEAAHLATSLQGLVRPGSDIILVGHSMGGLVILKALVDRMALGEAQLHPCGAIIWISLFASPLNGVWLAGILRRVFLIPLWALRGLHRHLGDLSRGSFVNDLMSQVTSCIYQPQAEDTKNRRIPIRIIAATRDRAVAANDRNAALAPYRNPAAQQLDQTHTSVKEPMSRDDLRYRVLAADLQRAITGTFRRLCSAVTDAEASSDDREVALEDIRRRYGKLIRLRLSTVKVPEAQQESAENELLLLIAGYGAIHEEPPFSVVHRAATILEARHKDWR